jgi:hypothetical protein
METLSPHCKNGNPIGDVFILLQWKNIANYECGNPFGNFIEVRVLQAPEMLCLLQLATPPRTGHGPAVAGA